MQLEQRVTGEAPRTRSVAGNVICGSLGNLIECYDWYAYAAFSIYFARALSSLKGRGFVNRVVDQWFCWLSASG